MKRIRTGISTNSVSIGNDGRYYAVGYRNNIYGENEWLVRFTPSYDNALLYIENEKREHATEPRLEPEYRLWECRLQDGKEAPAVRPELEIDY